MDNGSLASLAYLALLLLALAGWFIAQARRKPGQTAQHAMIWGLIFVAVIAGAGLWGDIRRTVLPQQSIAAGSGQIIVPRGPNGHYHLTAIVNGTPLRFVVDTGATDVVLSTSDAERVGIDLDTLVYSGRARTANGEVRIAPVRIDITLGDTQARGLRASVNEGDLFQSLLGMSYLSRFSRVEIARGELILTP